MVSLDRIGLERMPLADAMMSLSLRCMTLVSACWTLPVLGADTEAVRAELDTQNPSSKNNAA